MATGWGDDGWGDNTWGGFQLEITGNSAAGAVGTVTASGGNPFFITGVNASGAAGSVSMGARTVALTGVSAQGQAGTANYFYWSIIDDNQTPNWQNVPMTV